MSFSKSMKKWLLLTVTALLLTGCSDTSEEALGQGDAIQIMFIGQITDTANATPTPEAAEGVRAAVDSINAQGGLEGMPLALIICDDRADANEAAKCARKASRAGVVAALGNASNFGNVILPILEQAGIASMGHNPISPQDFSSPAAFPLQSGSPGTVAGAAKLLADQGVKRIRIASVDSPAGAVGQRFAEAGLHGTTSQVVGLTLVPIGAPDYAIYANTVLKDSDGILVSMNADQAARFITAVRQINVKIPIAVTMAALPPATIKQLGQAAEGIMVSMPFLPVTAGGETVEQFLADMNNHAPQVKINGFSLQGWLAVQTFYHALSDQQSEITAASVMARLSNLEGLSFGNLVAPLTTTQEKAAPFNRLFNNKILYGKVEGGKIILIDGHWREISVVK